ncbi:MAG: hypothetical protein LBE97_00055 [Holosporales bacterium]|jgi:hypothetical protein|nr:hypothetical protein [Holosporales bacterium]
MDRLIAKVKTKNPFGLELIKGEKESFDGSEEYMISVLRVVSECGGVKPIQPFMQFLA